MHNRINTRFWRTQIAPHFAHGFNWEWSILPTDKTLALVFYIITLKNVPYHSANMLPSLTPTRSPWSVIPQSRKKILFVNNFKCRLPYSKPRPSKWVHTFQFKINAWWNERCTILLSKAVQSKLSNRIDHISSIL